MFIVIRITLKQRNFVNTLSSADVKSNANCVRFPQSSISTSDSCETDEDAKIPSCHMLIIEIATGKYYNYTAFDGKIKGKLLDGSG